MRSQPRADYSSANLPGLSDGERGRRCNDRSPRVAKVFPPVQVAAGQEVVGGILLTAADYPPGNAREDSKVEPDHQPVQRCDVRLGTRRLEEQTSGKNKV